MLHCVERGVAGKIGRPTIAAAIEIARFLIPHAEVVLNMMQARDESRDSDSRYVLQWMMRHDRAEFKKRDAQQHGKRRFHRADDIDPALAELTRRGYIRLRPTIATGPGRPASPIYEVNPAAFTNEDHEMCSQYSHNSTDPSQNGNSENIESAFGQSENTNRVQVTI